jgi:hypothetical protein
MSPRKKQIADDTIDQLLEWDIIESLVSRLLYQVVIVKQNGKDRYCVDYRNLNRHTKPLIYPMQRSDEIFDALAGKKVFSLLDAARGYPQVPIKEEHRWKTAFLTHSGLFEYKTMPFGLKTAPALFQQFMDKVLGGLCWTAALCYIDDVIIFSDSIEEHAEHVRKILQSAIGVGLKFTPAKCHFAYASLTLLGRRVSTEGLKVLQDKLAAVRELKPPKTIKELWHVLGLFGYYRAFIHRYSIIAAPLTALTGLQHQRQSPRSSKQNGDSVVRELLNSFRHPEGKVDKPTGAGVSRLHETIHPIRGCFPRWYGLCVSPRNSRDTGDIQLLGDGTIHRTSHRSTTRRPSMETHLREARAFRTQLQYKERNSVSAGTHMLAELEGLPVRRFPRRP